MSKLSFSVMPSIRGGGPSRNDGKPALFPELWQFKFAPRKTGPLFASVSNPATWVPITDPKASKFKVHKIVGDGRCMFRATVRSLALHKGVYLRSKEELSEAEQLRLACHDALCRTSQRSKHFPDARKQVLFGYGDLNSYCNQLARPSFWGGEVEMMILTKMLQVPIYVYTPAHESGGQQGEFNLIARFGRKFAKPTKSFKGRQPVCLLYTGGNHYDLLIPT